MEDLGCPAELLKCLVGMEVFMTWGLFEQSLSSILSGALEGWVAGIANDEYCTRTCRHPRGWYALSEEVRMWPVR